MLKFLKCLQNPGPHNARILEIEKKCPVQLSRFCPWRRGALAASYGRRVLTRITLLPLASGRPGGINGHTRAFVQAPRTHRYRGARARARARPRAFITVRAGRRVREATLKLKRARARRLGQCFFAVILFFLKPAPDLRCWLQKK